MGFYFCSTFSSLFFHAICICFIVLHANSATPVERSTYIVHTDKSTMPKAFTNHHHWHSSIVDSLTSAKSSSSSLDDPYYFPPSLVYSYDNALHGFSASLSLDELEEIKKSPWFISSYMDRTATLDTTHTYKFLSLNPSQGLWPASNYGEGVIVGVIDSGVWPESESFQDHGMPSKIPSKWKGKCEVGQDFNSSLCNSKLIGVRYFNKGLKLSRFYHNISMNSARDTVGHGTHVASTVSGNYANGASFFGYAKGTARGIAPRSRLAAYKVSWNEGSQTSDVLAGMDQAIEDGVDVISISMGFDGVPLYEDPVAIASFAAMEKGVFVSSSAGNAGPDPHTLHNGIPWTLTVAASTIDRSFGGSLTFGDNFTITGWTMFPANAIVEKVPLYYNKAVSRCDSAKNLSSLQYNVVMCEDIGSIATQMREITLSQTLGAIIISNDNEILELGGVTCPCILITPKEAMAVIKYARSTEMPFVSMKFQQTVTGTKPAPSVAFYSSRGPSPSSPGILKPDIMAPGSLVLASWIPQEMAAQIGANVYLSSEYNMISGTSMACPHAAGVAAMLKGVHPDWSPAAIRSAMMTTANPLDSIHNLIRDNGDRFRIASPLAMGAGQIDPNRALDPGLIYDATPQDYVNLLCSMKFTTKQILAITRSKHYRCSKPSSDLNYPSFILLNDGKTKTVFRKFQRLVTNMGDGVVRYNVSVTAPKGSIVVVSPKVLAFEKKYEKQKYFVAIKHKSYKTSSVSFGEIVWVEENGNHTVRSPIVVSPVWKVPL
uniref:Subtilisin n=1 Tax=Ceanothus thyrsiflorus TaxID=48245 RepID=A0A3Q8UAZ1_CEATH|nr:subtilisin [Ceanothus thyrsiflorus]